MAVSCPLVADALSCPSTTPAPVLPQLACPPVATGVPQGKSLHAAPVGAVTPVVALSWPLAGLQWAAAPPHLPGNVAAVGGRQGRYRRLHQRCSLCRLD